MNPAILSGGCYWTFDRPSQQSNWVKWRDYVSFQHKEMCVYYWMNTCTFVHTQCVCSCAAADVWDSARRLSRCLLHARIYWEKKHKADCRARMDHLEIIILRESILGPLILNFNSPPCPSVPISSLKVVYSSCLFFGIISVKKGG